MDGSTVLVTVAPSLSISMVPVAVTVPEGFLVTKVLRPPPRSLVSVVLRMPLLASRMVVRVMPVPSWIWVWVVPLGSVVWMGRVLVSLPFTKVLATGG